MSHENDTKKWWSWGINENWWHKNLRPLTWFIQGVQGKVAIFLNKRNEHECSLMVK